MKKVPEVRLKVAGFMKQLHVPLQAKRGHNMWVHVDTSEEGIQKMIRRALAWAIPAL